MPLLTALILVFSMSAHAKNTARCLRLLINGEPVNSVPNANQRQNALSLDLATIRPAPAEGDNVHQLNAAPEIEQLSKLNLERLSKKLRERLQVKNENDPRPGLDAALANVDFVPLARMEGNNDFNPTLKPGPEFLSLLTQNNRTVYFQMTAVTKGQADAQVSRLGTLYAKLDEKTAADQGVVLPQFSNVHGLINFFAEHDPQILERVVRSNKWNLPSNVKTVPEFLAYVDGSNGNELFPEAELYNRLGVLRQQLHRYILTEADAREFAKLVLKLDILKSVENGSKLNDNLTALRNDPIRFFAIAMVSSGFEGLTLRMPISVPPGQLSIIRPLPTPEIGVRANLGGSRSVDHRTAP